MNAFRYLFAVLAAGALLPATLHAAPEAVGKAAAVVGTVDVQAPAADASRPLAFNDEVFLNDQVRTGEASLAKLLLRDDSVLKIGPASRLVLSEQVVGGDERRTTVELLQGRLRSVIGDRLPAGSYYRVKTPVAVAGVRGTDFAVLVRSPQEVAVRSYAGRVEVRNVLEQVVGQVVLEPNSYTLVREGMAPTPPQFIAPGESLPGGQGGSAASDEEALQAQETARIDTVPGAAFDPGAAIAPPSGGPATGARREAVREGIDAAIGDAVAEAIGSDAVQREVISEPRAGSTEVPIDIEIPTL